MGVVEHIHIAAQAGKAMQPVDDVYAIKGIGLEGDRYALGAGYWGDAKLSRDLTLIEAEVIEKLERDSGILLAPGEARRNLTTRGIDLTRSSAVCSGLARRSAKAHTYANPAVISKNLRRNRSSSRSSVTAGFVRGC